ncbi:MAG: hypothetical protein ACLR6J_16185 [Parabacteroides merdae]
MKPKYTKDIKSILSANHVYLFNGGAYYFDKQRYKSIPTSMWKYPNCQCSQGLRLRKKTLHSDSSVLCSSSFFVLRFQIGSIAALERAKNTPYRQYDVYQYLCYEYGEARTAQDSVMLEKTFEEGMQVFPDSAFFLNNLINTYIFNK